MNTKTSKRHLAQQDLSMFNGLQKWQWDLTLEFHGLCANKLMLLILWLVLLSPRTCL